MKNKKIKLKYLSLFAISIFLLPQMALAVPPPDFIIQTASSIAAFFAIGTAFFLAVLTTGYQFIKAHLTKHKKVYWVVGPILALVLAGLGAYFYDQYNQKTAQEQAVAQWLEESGQYTQVADQNIPPADFQATANEIDQLKQENESAQNSDKGEAFIRGYYTSIAAHDFEAAYAISKKSAPLEAFSDWYVNTTQIQINDLVKIDNTKYSLKLSLWEEEEKTNYAVLTTLRFEEGQPVQIQDSQVQVLGKESTTASVVSSTESDSVTLAQAITNEEFQAALKASSEDYIILDARENIEFENGHLPGSIHIRFADLRAGRWIELPQEKPIYVICWSGIRGSEVAEYLRQKGLEALYLEKGANEWVKFGGEWIGDIKFNDVYTADRYKLVFSTHQVKEKIAEGVKIVDSRPPSVFEKEAISGSINIPLMYTSTSNLESTFAQLSPGGKVITVCDGYVNCFDAKLTGVELERRGYTFLGRYNKPWNF